MEKIKTAQGRRIRYRLPRPLQSDELQWARKQARQAGLSLTTWLRRVSQTMSSDNNAGVEESDETRPK